MIYRLQTDGVHAVVYFADEDGNILRPAKDVEVNLDMTLNQIITLAEESP